MKISLFTVLVPVISEPVSFASRAGTWVYTDQVASPEVWRPGKGKGIVWNLTASPFGFRLPTVAPAAR